MSPGARLAVPLATAAALTGCLAATSPAPPGGLAAVAPAAGPGATAAAGPATVEPALPPTAWPAAADCRARAAAVLALSEAERERLPAEGATLALALVDAGGTLLPSAEAAGRLEVDLPVPVVERAGETDCLILAGPTKPVVGLGGRRLTGHEVVRSEYRSGGRRSSDATARARYRDIEEQQDNGSGGGGLGIMRTGDPMLDLIGLASGLVIRGAGRLWPARDRDEAAALADAGAGPGGSAAEGATYRPYTYEVSTFELERAGVVEVALVDRAAARTHEARQTVRERRAFPVAKGRHASDRGLLERTGRQAALPADLDVFEATPPRPRLTDLLRALAVGTGEGRPGGASEALAALSQGGPTTEPIPAAGPPASPADPAAPLTVLTAAGRVAATPLGPGRFEVPATALGRSSLVEVLKPDGSRAFGLVERVDAATGRAVVRVGGVIPVADAPPTLSEEAP